jgi:hypothetical protein
MSVGVDAAGDNVHAHGVNHPGIETGGKPRAYLADAFALNQNIGLARFFCGNNRAMAN